MNYKIKKPFRVGGNKVLSPKVIADKAIEVLCERNFLYFFLADTNLRHQKFHTSVNGVTMFFDLEKNDSGSDFILQLSFDMTNVDEGIIPILKSGANLVYKRLGLSNTATEAPSFQPKYIKLEGGYR